MFSRVDYKDKDKTKNKAFWLHEFMYDLEKNAHQIDFLKDYVNKNFNNKKEFLTIDEKLADIKHRVGFDLAVKVVNEMEKTSTASSDCDCNDSCRCKIKTASNESDVFVMGNILKYIREMTTAEPHLNSSVILSRCKEEPQLRYYEIESRIDSAKLLNYIKSLLKHPKTESVNYISIDNDSNLDADNTADYYGHANPSR